MSARKEDLPPRKIILRRLMRGNRIVRGYSAFWSTEPDERDPAGHVTYYREDEARRLFGGDAGDEG